MPGRIASWSRRRGQQYDIAAVRGALQCRLASPPNVCCQIGEFDRFAVREEREDIFMVQTVPSDQPYANRERNLLEYRLRESPKAGRLMPAVNPRCKAMTFSGFSSLFD